MKKRSKNYLLENFRTMVKCSWGLHLISKNIELLWEIIIIVNTLVEFTLGKVWSHLMFYSTQDRNGYGLLIKLVKIVQNKFKNIHVRTSQIFVSFQTKWNIWLMEEEQSKELKVISLYHSTEAILLEIWEHFCLIKYVILTASKLMVLWELECPKIKR